MITFEDFKRNLTRRYFVRKDHICWAGLRWRR